MTYDAFRHFADSWGLLFMAICYLAFIGWALLPRNRERSKAAKEMIFDSNRLNGNRDNG